MEDLNKKLSVRLQFGLKVNTLLILFIVFWLGWMAWTAWEVSSNWFSEYHEKNYWTNYNTLMEVKHQQRLRDSLEQGDDSLGGVSNILIGGDVMLARNVQQLQERCGDYYCAWKNIGDKFAAADLAIINLESPLTKTGPYLTEGLVFRAKPDNLMGLKKSGIDLVYLANNHFGNGGLEGMNDTFELLSSENIDYLGAGQDTDQAYQGKIVYLPDATIGLVSQSYDISWYAAKHNQPGIAVHDLKKLKSTINELKKQEADIIIASYHGGVEYVTEPNYDQVEFAQAAIDYGADLVIGHHPHWIQESVIYKDKYIFYSLGNLIFDQNWSIPTSQGLVLEVVIADQEIKDLELHPVIVEDNFRPRWATSKESIEILAPAGLDDFNF